MCREFRPLQGQYHEYFSAEKFLDPDSLASAHSVFEKLQVFTFQPHWIFYFIRIHKICSMGLRIPDTSKACREFLSLQEQYSFPIFSDDYILKNMGEAFRIPDASNSENIEFS
jgi:hypothetical protein